MSRMGRLVLWGLNYFTLDSCVLINAVYYFQSGSSLVHYVFFRDRVSYTPWLVSIPYTAQDDPTSLILLPSIYSWVAAPLTWAIEPGAQVLRTAPTTSSVETHTLATEPCPLSKTFTFPLHPWTRVFFCKHDGNSRFIIKQVTNTMLPHWVIRVIFKISKLKPQPANHWSNWVLLSLKICVHGLPWSG